MPVTSLHDGWTVGPQISLFAKLVASTQPTEVTLPHDALISAERSPNNSGKGAFFPSGAFEYSRTLDAPETWRNKRVWLRFDGVYRDAMVFINGDLAAHRPNGYVPFDVDVTGFLRFGEANTIRVEMRTHDDSRWYAGAGIYRDVLLDVRELVHVVPGDLHVTTPVIEHDQAQLESLATVANRSNETRTLRARLTVTGPDGETVAQADDPVTVPAGGTVAVRSRVCVEDPALWSVQSPSLYRATLDLVSEAGVVDTESTAVGIRSLQVDPRHGLRINGEEVLLRGTCLHHDNGPLGAAAHADAEERKIRLLKDAGFNAVRSAHNMMSSAMLDACDRLGVLVMDEAFDMWTVQKSSFDGSITFAEWWEKDIEAMVRRDRNHPSVIFYSIGNEIPETGSGRGGLLSRQMAEHVRSLDPARLVTNGINGFVSVIDDVMAMMAGHQAPAAEDASTGDDASNGEAAPTGGVNDVMSSSADGMNQLNRSDLVTDRTEESLAALDVAGLNYGDARYEMDAERFPRRVIVGSETYPTRIASNWELVERLPHVIGDFTWTGWDYLGEVGIGRPKWQGESLTLEASYPWLTAWCGDLDITGFRRPASFYREIVFGLRRDPYIAVRDPENNDRVQMTGSWSWSEVQSTWEWGVAEGTTMTVEVYAPGDEVELLLDGESLGRRPAGKEHAFTAVFEVPFRSGALEAVAREAGEEIGRFRIASRSGEPRLRVRPETSEVTSGPGRLVYVPIEIVDESGTMLATADEAIHVDIDGPAKLLALGSGRPDNHEPFGQTSHKAFRGRVLAILQPTGPGTVTVRASGKHTGRDEARVEVTR